MVLFATVLVFLFFSCMLCVRKVYAVLPFADQVGQSREDPFYFSRFCISVSACIRLRRDGRSRGCIE